MPFGWIMFSTASTPAAKKCRQSPTACEDELKQDLASCGAELIGRLHFEADKSEAYAKVKDLDNPICRKGVLEKWGATYRKLLTPEEAEAAFAHATRLIEQPGNDYIGPQEGGYTAES
jgi:hypothetical protein